MNHDANPGVPLTPPTMPGPIGRAQTTWPRGVGITCVVFGCLALLSGVSGLIGAVVANVVATGAAAGPMAGFEKYTPWLLANAVVTLGLGTTLTLGGVRLCQRRAIGRRLVLAYAVAKIIFCFNEAALTYVMQKPQLQASFQATPTPLPASFADMIAKFSVVLVIAWGSALPVFLIVWFAREKIRREVAAWSEGVRSG